MTRHLRRGVLLLYDCDVGRPPSEGDGLWVRRLSRREDNAIMSGGIENLLPEVVFEESFWVETTKRENGREVRFREVDKTRLCTAVCGRASATDFAGFSDAVALVCEFVAATGGPAVIAAAVSEHEARPPSTPGT